MKLIKGMPLGLWILSVFIVLFEITYYVRPILSGYESPYGSPFTLSVWAFFVWFNVALSILMIISVTYGFYNAKNWARLYAIGYVCYSSFWNLYVIFIMGAWSYERFGWFVFYVIIIMYLLMSQTRDYFMTIKR
ncbi:MAG: hypothetical protein KAS76_03255 [Thermoplasmatales archaeon]|nr:hypothetical protein [Thermoplasmatales archaeon]